MRGSFLKCMSWNDPEKDFTENYFLLTPEHGFILWNTEKRQLCIELLQLSRSKIESEKKDTTYKQRKFLYDSGTACGEPRLRVEPCRKLLCLARWTGLHPLDPLFLEQHTHFCMRPAFFPSKRPIFTIVANIFSCFTLTREIGFAAQQSICFGITQHTEPHYCFISAFTGQHCAFSWVARFMPHTSVRRFSDHISRRHYASEA